MAGCLVGLWLAALVVANTNAASSLERIRGISRVDPILGLVTPSQDIRDLLASVARNNSKEKNTNVQRYGSTSGENSGEVDDPNKDTGEDMRPSDGESRHANMGFELYWPGGEWVQRKAKADYCETSAKACPLVYKRYGQVCASSIDYEAQHTFRDLCELEDTNCRDGWASLITASDEPESIRWFQVKRNSSFVMKFSSPGWLKMIFAREPDLSVQPQLVFFLDSSEKYELYAKNRYWDGYNTYMTYEKYWPKNWKLPRTQVRHFQATWVENGGYVHWVDLDNPSYNYDLPYKKWQRKERMFPVRYFGVWGGSESQPNWIELKGDCLPRGYLASYRGPCRPDLPTLEPIVPKRMGERHKIQLFDFAERMDVFGFNFSRINGTLPNEYLEDYYNDYRALP